jgi:hypothetical protein
MKRIVINLILLLFCFPVFSQGIDVWKVGEYRHTNQYLIKKDSGKKHIHLSYSDILVNDTRTYQMITVTTKHKKQNSYKLCITNEQFGLHINCTEYTKKVSDDGLTDTFTFYIYEKINHRAFNVFISGLNDDSQFFVYGRN